MKTRLHHLSDALRLPFLMASFLPALAAGSLAWHDGALNPYAWALAALAVVGAHAGTNLANDYFDYRAGNYPEKKLGPTGGSFAIQSGHYTPGQIFGMAAACFVLSLALFAYLASATAQPLIFSMGAAGLLIGFFYTAPPLKFGYRLLGEVCTFVGMGPLLFATVYLSATGTLPSAGGWMLSVFLGVLVLNILLAAQVPDIEMDQRSRKRTIAAEWGPSALTVAYGLCSAAGAAALLAAVFAYRLPPLVLVALVGSHFSYQAYRELEAGRALPALGLSLKALQTGAGLAILALLVAYAFA